MSDCAKVKKTDATKNEKKCAEVTQMKSNEKKHKAETKGIACAEVVGNTETTTPKMCQSKNWVFTIFDNKENTLKKLKQEQINFYNFQVERCPSTNKIHCQGFVQFKSKKRLTEVKKIICNKSHFETMKGSYDDNINYTSKENTKVEGPFTEGLFSQMGKSTKLSHLIEVIKETGNLTPDLKNSECYIKHMNSLKNRIKECHQEKKQKEFSEKMDKFIPDQFQKFLENLLINQDDRTILWLWDPVGNSGKSSFCDYMKHKNNAFVCANSNQKDMMEAYNYEDIIIIDLSRHEMEFINYSLYEKLKNGLIFKQKYDSSITFNKNIKLAIMSNCEPDITKFSLDRWLILKKINDEWTVFKKPEGKDRKRVNNLSQGCLNLIKKEKLKKDIDNKNQDLTIDLFN